MFTNIRIMTKKLITNALVHELEGSDFFPAKQAEVEETLNSAKEKQPPKITQADEQPSQSTNPSIN